MYVNIATLIHLAIHHLVKDIYKAVSQPQLNEKVHSFD